MKTRTFRIILIVSLSLFAGAEINRAQKTELVVQTNDSFIVESVTFTPDGKTLASGNFDGTIKLWDVESGRELRTLMGHFRGISSVRSVALNADGNTLASAGWDTTIKLWDIRSGKELTTLTGHSNSVSSVAFSSDGKTLASGSKDTTIKLWDVRSRKELRTLKGLKGRYEVLSVAFSSDGKTLASGSNDNTIQLWDVKSGKESRTLKGHSDPDWPTDSIRRADPVLSVSFSSDGKTLASGSSDKTIKFWDVRSGKELRTLRGHSDFVRSVAFSADGKTLASGSKDTTIKLWDVESGKELRTLTGHTDAVSSVTFNSDEKTLASGSDDSKIKIWDVKTGKELRTLSGPYSDAGEVAFSPDGNTLATRMNETIRLWDLASGGKSKTLKGHPSLVHSVAFSTDGKKLASDSGEAVRVWEVESGKQLSTLTGNFTLVRSVAFSSDGKRLASGNHTTVELWDVESENKVKTLKGHSKKVWSVAFSADGKTLASGSLDSTIKLWDVESGTEMRALTGHSEHVISVAFSSDEKTLGSGSQDTQIKLWDFKSGKELRALTGHSQSVTSISFSSDGRTLASGSGDNTIKLWDVASGKELRTLTGHSDSVESVAFSSDTKILASGSDDRRTKIWDVATGREICSLIALDESEWVVTTPDGRFDTNKNLDSIEGLHWLVSDDPLKPLPLEIFMRDYYEPQLLPRLIKCNRENNCDKEFKLVRDISKLNRVQPPVEIKNVSTPDAEGYVNVTVEVGRAEGKFVQQGRAITRTTDVYDLRLFRDGQMVAYWPYDGAQKLLDQTANDLKTDSNFSDEAKVVKEGHDWQQATRVELDTGGRKTLTARVRLPKGKDVGQTEFTAYGFNEDRVKSQTGKWVWPADVIAKLPKARVIKPRAYVITIGVNASQNPNWRLQYAVNDALKMRDTLSGKLKELKQADGLSERYDVVAFPLVSEYDGDGATLKSNDATKQKIQAVFDLLAGRKVVDKLLAALQASVPQVGQLRKAEPDDLILISFSSHGYTDRSGNFFILPYDIGSASKITPDLLSHCISSEELSLWLRDVDAGEMVMIIDACHAAAFTGKDFKPGPMASRGLGQLAYDKGMRILTATQANDFALESGSLGQGLLSYALVENGLKEGRADFKPTPDGRITMNEWLEYGAAQVPTLYDKLIRGELKAIGIGARAAIIGAKQQRQGYQQRPSLFDFARKRADITISVKQPT